MKIGIEKISFFTPPFYIEMKHLAQARDVDPAKYTIGIGQDQMAVSPVHYDAVALAINAGISLDLTAADKAEIDTIILATESGVDHSKSGSTWIHRALGIQPHARAIEMKQACYSATAAIRLAMGHISLHPDKKVLVIASDIANYGIHTPGEPTQGAGAVAMLLSSDAKIMAFDTQSVPYTVEISDFWRPLYSDTPFVDGKYSNQAYVETFQGAWNGYKALTGRVATDFDALLFHVPYTKMGKKTLQSLAATGDLTDETLSTFTAIYDEAVIYNRRVGNLYTGSLYLSLISFLEQAEAARAGARIGMFSYGSGAVGEFFAGELMPNFETYLQKERHEQLLDHRFLLDIPTYEMVLSERIAVDEAGNWLADTSLGRPGQVVLEKISAHKRYYKMI
ncbi:hydroxymethylglutaryl-CoA synthase [Allofustis seminis]|uniref:hydroxymethylglutaryl-CoA synthase n=1 Tax=Allofustis seminis TaxID=166939 RepID=UPI00037AD543|nr:hydroxymethylglutaryl-CoA synthase [Allofustis seminis]